MRLRAYPDNSLASTGCVNLGASENKQSPYRIGISAIVKRASDHCKGAMEIDSTGIIAFDGAKCDMEL